VTIATPASVGSATPASVSSITTAQASFLVGDLVLLAVSDQNGAVAPTTVTGTGVLGGTWTLLGTGVNAAGTSRIRLLSQRVATEGVGTATASWASSVTNPRAALVPRRGDQQVSASAVFSAGVNQAAGNLVGGTQTIPAGGMLTAFIATHPIEYLPTQAASGNTLTNADDQGLIKLRYSITPGSTNTTFEDGGTSSARSIVGVLLTEAGGTPTAPTIGAVDQVTHNAFRANWVDNSDNETGFEVEAVAHPSNTVLATLSAPTNATSIAFNSGNSAALSATAYKIRVRATGAGGPSAWSAYSAVFSTDNPITGGPSMLPSAGAQILAPSILAAAEVSHNSFVARWVDNSNNETGFTVRVVTDPAEVEVGLFSAGANEISRRVTGLASVSKYKYQVKALGASESAYSAFCPVVTTDNPLTGFPSLLPAPAGPGDLQISVQPVSRRVPAGRPVTFAVAASSASGPIQYQVQKLVGAQWQDVPGATSSTFSLPSAQLIDHASTFRFRLRQGQAEQFSELFNLEVAGALALLRLTPASLTVPRSNRANLVVTAVDAAGTPVPGVTGLQARISPVGAATPVPINETDENGESAVRIDCGPSAGIASVWVVKV
jgi:hypothetical protein